MLVASIKERQQRLALSFPHLKLRLHTDRQYRAALTGCLPTSCGPD
jgi:hypothetical protein